LGGPIRKAKLWFWGSYGSQRINTGIVGFYCRPGVPGHRDGPHLDHWQRL